MASEGGSEAWRQGTRGGAEGVEVVVADRRPDVDDAEESSSPPCASSCPSALVRPQEASCSRSSRVSGRGACREWFVCERGGEG